MKNREDLRKFSKTERKIIINLALSNLMRKNPCLAGKKCIYKKNVVVTRKTSDENKTEEMGNTSRIQVTKNSERNRLSLQTISTKIVYATVTGI